MKYQNKIIAELNEFESFVRTCFVCKLGLPNGQDRNTNEFIDAFMQDIMYGNVELDTLPQKFRNGFNSCQVHIDTCLLYLLPQCRQATAPKNTDLYDLVSEWADAALCKCEKCGEWFMIDYSDAHGAKTVCPACEYYECGE